MKIIDVHTHGISGFSTVTSSAEDILHIAQFHGARGISGILPVVYPSSIESMRRHMQSIKKAMDIQRSDSIKGELSASSAHIAGIYLEGPFLNPSRCGALDRQSFLRPDEGHLMRLTEGFEDCIRIITVAPEMEGAVPLIKKISDMGIIASMGHSEATYAEAESGFHAGARGITHLFNAMRGIHHREPGIAGFGLMQRDIYIEVITDPFHLDPKIIELIFSVKNPERILIISDTVKESCTDAATHGIKDEAARLLGGSMTIKDSSERLVREGLEKDAVYRAISENPARYLNV